jgi:hypothetical protein
MTAAQAHIRRGNRRQLWILVVLFALPPIAAWLFYFNPQWLPQGRSNHGELIDPPIELQGFALQTPQGEAFDWGLLRDRWTMLLLAEGRCDEHCIEQLIKVRQIRRALGANRQRIERLLILLPDSAGNLQPPSLDGLEGTRVAVAGDADAAAVREALAAAPAIDNSLYVVDPRGDLMMAHEMTRITSKEVLQDLEKLLKASQSWVKGGQYGHK